MTTATLDQDLNATLPLDGNTAPADTQQQSAQAPIAPVSPDPTDSRAFAITSFVLGIASIVSGWTLIAPVIGLVLGSVALRRGTGERNLALWGVWLNGVMLGLTVLALTAVAILLGLGLLGAAWLPFVA